MSWKIAAVAATGLCFISGQVLAQNASLPTLSGLQGAVYVDQGNGFTRADAHTVLHRGDRVMASHGGLVRLSYKDGCNVQVSSRTLATVGAQSPCAGGSAPRLMKADYQTDAPPPSSGSSGGMFGGMSTTGLIVGGAAAAGIIAVIVAAATDNGSSPAGSSGGTSGGGGGPVSP